MYMLFVAIRFRHEIDIGSLLFCMKMTEHGVMNSKIVSNMKYLSNISRWPEVTYITYFSIHQHFYINEYDVITISI